MQFSLLHVKPKAGEFATSSSVQIPTRQILLFLRTPGKTQPHRSAFPVQTDIDVKEWTASSAPEYSIPSAVNMYLRRREIQIRIRPGAVGPIFSEI